MLLSLVFPHSSLDYVMYGCWVIILAYQSLPLRSAYNVAIKRAFIPLSLSVVMVEFSEAEGGDVTTRPALFSFGIAVLAFVFFLFRAVELVKIRFFHKS